MTSTYAPGAAARPDRPGAMSGLWRRQLEHYPSNGRRSLYLGISVLATIVLYYELYVQGAVSTQILRDYHMSLRYLILILVVGNALGAFASLAAGLADRWGRANLVAFGLGITGLLVLFALPHAGSKGVYLVAFCVVSVVEGVILVATPALIRDFSPQLGRGAAMGFWTLGPVLGSLVVTEVSSQTLTSHPNWRFQFYVAGIAGLVVFVIALIGLRELSPRLRDQLMVSLRDRALIEARAAGIDPEQALTGHWRQMLRPDIIGSAFAISIFLLFYYISVAFFVVYFATSFGYSPARANALANWYWIANAIALVVAGLSSDLIKVRKPFMLLGALISAVGVGLFAASATTPSTSYYTFAGIIVLIAAGGGIAYCGWMAAFTETVEFHNPAATATGLAVWGWVLRMVVTVSFAALAFIVSSAGPLVDYGPTVQSYAAQYAPQLKTAAALDPATSAALGRTPNNPAVQAQAVAEVATANGTKLTAQQVATLSILGSIDTPTLITLSTNPTDTAAQTTAVGEIASKLHLPVSQAQGALLSLASVPKAELTTLIGDAPAVQTAAGQLKALGGVPADRLAFLQAHGAAVVKAQHDAPSQWQHYWEICLAGQLLFIPFIWLLRGRWSPAAARRDAELHEERMQAELAQLTGAARV